MFEEGTETITFKWSVSPNLDSHQECSMTISINGKEVMCYATAQNSTTRDVFNCTYTIQLSQSDKEKAVTWYPKFEDVEPPYRDGSAATFSFRSSPESPVITMVTNSATPSITWTHNDDKWGVSQSDVQHKHFFRVWVVTANDNDNGDDDKHAAILLGTTNETTKHFETPNSAALPSGNYMCYVEAVVGDAAVLVNRSTPVSFVVNTTQSIPPTVVIEGGPHKTISDTSKPTLQWNITSMGDTEGDGTAEVTLVYGSGYVASDTHDVTVRVDGVPTAGAGSYTFVKDLKNQAYHWYVVVRNAGGVFGRSETATFYVNCTTAPEPVAADYPADGATVAYTKGSKTTVPLKWVGRGWGGFAGDSSASSVDLSYEVKCNTVGGSSSSCTVVYTPQKSGVAQPEALAEITGPTNGAQITWNVTAKKGNDKTYSKEFLFTLCERPDKLEAPVLSSPAWSESSTPALSWSYTPPALCGINASDASGTVLVTITNTELNDKRIYSVDANSNTLSIPETLPSGRWTAGLTATAPGYAAVASASTVDFVVCENTALPTPEITSHKTRSYESEAGSITINFTAPIWSATSGHCNRSRTLTGVELLTVVGNRTARSTIAHTESCSFNADMNVYECSYTHYLDEGTTYLAVATKNADNTSTYSSPLAVTYKKCIAANTTSDVPLASPPDGACLSTAADAVLAWYPTALGAGTTCPVTESSYGYVVTINNAKTLKTVLSKNITDSRFNASSYVSPGTSYTWFVRPMTNSSSSSSSSADVFTFTVLGSLPPQVSDVKIASSSDNNGGFPFTVAWTTAWNGDCGRRSHAIMVNGAIVDVIDGDTTNYTFQENTALFPTSGGSASVSIEARQGAAVSSQKTITVTPTTYSTPVAPVPLTPAEGATVSINSSSGSSSGKISFELTWEPGDDETAAAAAKGSVTYKVYFGTTPDTATEVATTTAAETRASVSVPVESGSHVWAVRAIVAGKASSLSPFRTVVLCSERPADMFKLRWPLNGVVVPANHSVTFMWESTRFAESCSALPENNSYVLTISGTESGGVALSEHLAPGVSSYTVTLPGDNYTWSVTKYSGGNSVSATETWTVNAEVAQDPEAPTLVRDGISSVWPQVFRWEALGDDEWGSATCTGVTSEEEEINPRACTYAVYVGSNPAFMRYIGRTRNTSYTLQDAEIAVRGRYYWTVVADNGYTTSYNASMKNMANFTACTPLPPPALTLISPPSPSYNMPRDLSFGFVGLPIWGETCDDDDGDNNNNNGGYATNRYVLNVSFSYLPLADFIREYAADDTVILGENTTTSNIWIAKDTGYTHLQMHVPMQAYQWDVIAINSRNLSSPAPPNMYKLNVCENITVPAPLIDTPTETTIFTRPLANSGVKLSWPHIPDNDWYKESYSYGNVCPVSISKALKVRFWRAGDAAHNKTKIIGFDDNDFILVPFAAMVDPSKGVLTESARSECGEGGSSKYCYLEPDTDYFFQLEVSNNDVFFNYSEVVKLHTVAKDCRSVPCVNGFCDEMTLVCMCAEGFTGADCGKEANKSGGISNGLKYGLVGLGIFLFIVIVVIVVIAVIYVSKWRRQKLRPPPNFEELRVPPIKRPNYVPNLSGTPDEKLMEKALLDENSFPLVWAIFRAAGVTEADRLAKAFLYVFQRQGKGLEFITFLVSREIAETEEPSVLFRANSPATRAFKFYSKMIGLPYLFQTFAVMLQGIIRDINDAEEDLKEQQKLDEESGAGGPGGITLGEIDPENIDSRVGDENINVLTLQLLCQKFLLQIVRSDRNCPGELKHICAFIRAQLESKFPETVYKGVGAFIFLRFYNTAITVPESYGLMESK